MSSTNRKVLYATTILASALMMMPTPFVVKDNTATLADHIDIKLIETAISDKTNLDIGTGGFRLAATTDGLEITAYNKAAYDKLAGLGAKFKSDADTRDESDFVTIGQVRVALVTKDDLAKILESVARERRVDATSVVLSDNAWATLMGSLYGHFAGQDGIQKRA